MSDAGGSTRSRRQWEALAKTRLSKGEWGSAVEADFVRQGLDPLSARLILDEAVAYLRWRATRLLVGSAILAAVGLLVTVVSYCVANSSPSGGTCLIWYGPVISGVIASLIALRRLANIRR